MNSKHVRNSFDMGKGWYYAFMFIVAITAGIIISSGVFTVWQTVLLATIAFALFFIYNKPHVVLYVALPLMFIPLSLGTLFRLRITWAAEPLILILFLLIVIRNMQTSGRTFVLSHKNPFLLLIFLYVIVLVGNYFRNPLPASSALGMVQEMGGIRFYYEKILVFSLSLSVGYLAETQTSFRQKFFNLILIMASVVTVIGLLIFVWDSLYDFIENLIVTDVFNNASLLTGLWKRAVDPLTGALRNSVLWVTPLGILLLLADVTSISKPAKMVLLALFIAGLVLSATRNFFFGILCALLVWAILTHNKKMIIVLIIVGIVGFLIPGIGLLTKQFRRILYFPADLERLTSFRYELFKIYWRFFTQHPLFGVGVGMTEIEHIPAASPEYFLQQNLRFGGHGFFLGTLYTQGIIGLLPFVLLYIVAVRIGFVLFRNGQDDSSKALGLLAIMFVAYSIIPFLVGGRETYNQFFVIIGLVGGTYGYYRKKAGKST
ncbi:hypothetical protein AMJ87_12730 [candidate division WOR_3 bacterium SM23_60]|uniref:O-antigen ligase-related domain-containing protein n=1 Tax=candidate division WOR_3 bacterium SM23_60 TaxID=1703780 RepID=A0A0S8G6T2_UNCW3|nr:MAG: hypothetical protein AMJ87_12730 [candidate division WOR_3 bacterium SM23_60]